MLPTSRRLRHLENCRQHSAPFAEVNLPYTHRLPETYSMLMMSVIRLHECVTFTCNYPCLISEKDFSNPEIVRHLQFYPEETDGPVSEVWQAARWKEFKPSELTPMYAQGSRHFYIDEVAKLSDGQLVIPLAWIKKGGHLCADSRLINITPVSSSKLCLLICTLISFRRAGR
jgi:hypothetical protein